MIAKRWAKKNEIVLKVSAENDNSLSQNHQITHMRSLQVYESKWAFIWRNKPLVSFYFFSILTMAMTLLYYIRFIGLFYDCEEVAVLRQTITFLLPTIGYCQLSNW